jgi:tetratricopeptide (TPR) repeat protein
VLAEQGKLADAKVCFERARQFSPEGVDPDCGLGVVLARQGKTDEAIASFRRALALDPDSLLAHRNLANLLAGRDDAEAIAHLRRAIELDPDSAGDYHQLAGLLRQQGKTREADRYEALGKQAALRQAETLTERGSQLAGQSKFDDAVAQFQSAIAAAPDYAPAHCRLADALAAKGYLEQAAAEYRQALAIDPGLQPAREGLRRLEH